MVFGIGPGEWAVILLIAFLLFGPKKLPELARSLGIASQEYKKAVKEGEEALKEGVESKGGRKKKSDVVTAATALGIETKGKSDDELKKEIAARMKESEDGDKDE